MFYVWSKCNLWLVYKWYYRPVWILINKLNNIKSVLNYRRCSLVNANYHSTSDSLPQLWSSLRTRQGCPRMVERSAPAWYPCWSLNGWFGSVRPSGMSPCHDRPRFSLVFIILSFSSFLWFLWFLQVGAFRWFFALLFFKLSFFSA